MDQRTIKILKRMHKIQILWRPLLTDEDAESVLALESIFSTVF